MKPILLIILTAALTISCNQEPDYLFDSSGKEINCKGYSMGRCLAANCLNGFDLIEWQEFHPTTYRCRK